MKTLQYLVQFFVNGRFYGKQLHENFFAANFVGRKFTTKFQDSDYLILPVDVEVL